MTGQEWADAEKVVDPDFAGSIFEEIGLSAKRCPKCGAHLSGDIEICLNGCHLGDEGMLKMAAFMERLTVSVMEKMAEKRSNE